MEKPWSKDKRSWIFYLEKIKQDKDAVYGETDHTIYFFDCKTAHLYVWVKQLNTFTEVGISNFLRKLNGQWDDGDEEIILFGTRILYKGIELQERYRSNDAEILEYIDIKKELNRKYINISRKNFTLEGIQYFEKEIYSSLIDAVREALYHMEKQARGENAKKFHLVPQETSEEERDRETETFCQKVRRILEEECDKLLKQFPKEKWGEVTWTGFSKEQLDIMYPVIELITTASVLSYYAERGEWNIWDQIYTQNGESKSIWHKLVDEINDVLLADPFVLDLLGRASILFRISTIDMQLNESIVRKGGKRVTYFHELFLRETHFAIQQYRADENSLWGLRLILLQDKKGQKSERYEDISQIPRRNEEKLERWGNNLCNTVQIFLEGEEHEQMLLLRWLLKNIPTIGMFSDESGNVRVNVLGTRIMPSIFMNRNFKKLIIRRILERAKSDSIERFSTISWQNTEYFNSRDLPYNIFFVSRGSYSTYSCKSCIIPLKGDWFTYWMEESRIRKSTYNTKVHDFVKDLDVHEGFKKVDFFKIEKEIDEAIGISDKLGISWNVAEAMGNSQKKKFFFMETAPILLDGVASKVRSKDYKPEYSLCKLLEERNGWNDLYELIVKIGILGRLSVSELIENYVNQIKEMNAFKEICCAWYYCYFQKENILSLCSNTNEIYLDYCERNSAKIQEQKRMALYLQQKLDKRNIDKIEAGLQQYEREILQLITEEEIKDVSVQIEKLLLKYKYLADKLKQSPNPD